MVSCLERLLDPNLAESAALFVGSLISAVLKNMKARNGAVYILVFTASVALVIRTHYY